MARNRMERRREKRKGRGGERDLGVLTAREDGTTGNAVKFQNKLDSAPHPCAAVFSMQSKFNLNFHPCCIDSCTRDTHS